MAKKKASTEVEGDSIFDIISSIDDSAEILSESKTAVINDYIDTGSYILNAAMTGSIFKGVPTGRCLVLAGEPGTGKSYLALSICRNAQKKGYTPIYLDSESAIDIEFVKRLGCDPSNFIIKQVATISEVSTFLTRLCKKMLDMKEEDRKKIILVLDSLGNLTSDKEYTDTLEGTGKRDMTKQQEVKALFRTSATPLGKLGYPFVICSHVYKTMDFFAKTVVSGGCLVPESKIYTLDGVKAISDVTEDDFVLTSNGDFKEVVATFRYTKPTIKFTFDDGYEIECSYDHKFFNGNTWSKATELKVHDSLCVLDVEKAHTMKSVRITEIVKYDEEKEVCDLCVDDIHTYVSENGVINHNSGVNFNASVTMMLSTAKLDDKESDKLATKKVGDFTKTGVIVTAKPEKSRFTIPQKVKFQIPFFKKPNPYVGLEAYITWENSGIIRGEMLNEAEYAKLSESEKSHCYEMTDVNGNIAYAKPKDTSKKIVVKHLCDTRPLVSLFSSEVLTDDVLKNLDETVIRPSFELPSNGSTVDIDELIDSEEDE